MVDVTDSKSVGLIPRVGSSPTTGTKPRVFSASDAVEALGFLFFVYLIVGTVLPVLYQSVQDSLHHGIGERHEEVRHKAHQESADDGANADFSAQEKAHQDEQRISGNTGNAEADPALLTDHHRYQVVRSGPRL